MARDRRFHRGRPGLLRPRRPGRTHAHPDLRRRSPPGSRVLRPAHRPLHRRAAHEQLRPARRNDHPRRRPRRDGEHTDFGIVTVLWADQVAGLQVLGRDERWHDVAPADGALLVNLGDLTARLTNDRWMSTLHRVKPPIVDGTIKRRRSAAFFHDGNPDAVIETLASHHDASGLAYEPITVRDHIKAKLAGSRQGKKNLAAVREAARVLAAAERDL
ncbi:2OG-Fe(II) oxygenase family protein [Nonomuraea polychroma]|uniref:2OG-Fe(II) oxygenase family protein n=1 Tax=Nonomuraea polychroma TaxID=46176 RepID=UPI001F4E5549|nr:2OG-Fe(II) oxygenase family protein [Nonomuraea polychroma]